MKAKMVNENLFEFKKGMDPADVIKWKNYDDYLDDKLKKYGKTSEDFWEFYARMLDESQDTDDILNNLIDVLRNMSFHDTRNYVDFAYVHFLEDEGIEDDEEINEE